MTHYVTLTNKELGDSTIHFSFGSDCGVWLKYPTGKTKTIARMIVHEVQNYTHHSRRRMAYHFNWEKFIKKYANMYKLTINEEVT